VKTLQGELKDHRNMAGARSAPESVRTPRARHNVALDYLRTFAVILVLAHHAALAYFPSIPGPETVSLSVQPRLWKAFPILDSHRWSGFAIFALFNDVFFMSLLFFLSGLFVAGSLERKGTRTFMHDRMVRLGIPFVFAAAIVAPLAYYPAYAVRTADPTVAGFANQWLSLGEWPSGPAWFIWVLLAFDCAAAAIFVISPKFGQRLGEWLHAVSSGASRHPARLFLLLIAISALVYTPMAILFRPDYWTAFGPFHIQTCRVFHYATYFFFGIGVGAYGIGSGLLASDGMLARRALRWTIAMPLAFIPVCVFIVRLPSLSHTMSPIVLGLIGGPLFALSCGASCFGFLALFVRFVRRRTRVFDSLSENEYGMYLVHYAFVSWLGYAILLAPLPAVVKFALVFGGVLVLSWSTSAALRRIPAVARVV
jgi:peptidoglycan/LPS O-acetylase OafA/YrhL